MDSSPQKKVMIVEAEEKKSEQVLVGITSEQKQKEEQKKLDLIKRVFTMKEGAGIRTLPSGSTYLRGETGQLISMNEKVVPKKVRAKTRRRLKELESKGGL